MKKQIFKIIERVKKKNAVGIIYNIPKNDCAIISNKLLDEKIHIPIHGSDAFKAEMLTNRLGRFFKMKHFNLMMLPGLIDGKILTILGADVIMPSYSKVIENLSKMKIPLLLLLYNEISMEKIRKMNAYNRVLTIEFDYNSL
ncbi:MAG: hypothetical protein GYA14_14550 [Ignavibacteria bacterium]|nr:hypothetical protein [Ignavibacteria bacterium]